MKGYVSSLQSMGTLDGPGVRAVVFLEGCPLRCLYCHNPETWEFKAESEIDSAELCRRILRLYPYIKNGGVTFSGGEPCVQADFVSECTKALRAEGLHIALDTSGEVLDKQTERMLEYTDLVILDIKASKSLEYGYITGGGRLENALKFLDFCENKGKHVWIRQVIVPGFNDNADAIMQLKALLSRYACVEKTELLGFKKLCFEKYIGTNLVFPLADTVEMSAERLAELQSLI